MFGRRKYRPATGGTVIMAGGALAMALYEFITKYQEYKNPKEPECNCQTSSD